MINNNEQEQNKLTQDNAQTSENNINTSNVRRKRKIHRIALYGIVFALIFIARLLDRVISLAWPINLAVCTIAVSFVFILLSRNIWEALLMGTLFGVASLIAAVIFPSPEFMLPWVSVLPRMIVGIAVFGAYKLFFRILKKAKINNRRYFSAFIAAGVGVIVNTATVMFMLSLNRGEMQSYFQVVGAIMLSNFLPEFISAMLIVPFLTIGVSRGAKISIAGE